MDGQQANVKGSPSLKARAFPWGHTKPCPTARRHENTILLSGKHGLARLACLGAVDAETTLAFLEGIGMVPATTPNSMLTDSRYFIHSLIHSFTDSSFTQKMQRVLHQEPKPGEPEVRGHRSVQARVLRPVDMKALLPPGDFRAAPWECGGYSTMGTRGLGKGSGGRGLAGAPQESKGLCGEGGRVGAAGVARSLEGRPGLHGGATGTAGGCWPCRSLWEEGGLQRGPQRQEWFRDSRRRDERGAQPAPERRRPRGMDRQNRHAAAAGRRGAWRMEQPCVRVSVPVCLCVSRHTEDPVFDTCARRGERGRRQKERRRRLRSERCLSLRCAITGNFSFHCLFPKCSALNKY